MRWLALALMLLGGCQDAKCPDTFTIADGQCVCPSGTMREADRCVLPEGGMCPDGFMQQGDACVPIDGGMGGDGGTGGGGSGGAPSELAVSSGYSHTCGIADGVVSCWGSFQRGELGYDPDGFAWTPMPTDGVSGQEGIDDAVDVAAGDDFACAAIAPGNVLCWGDNNADQLGNDTLSMSFAPVFVPGVGGTGVLSGAESVCAGQAHACAVTDAGVVCWGWNFSGQLGSTGDQPLLVDGVSGGTLSGIEEVACGSDHTCARLDDNRVVCWGAGSSGQLGTGAEPVSAPPAIVLGVDGVGELSATSITAGGGFSCAVMMDGSVACWGNNNEGRLGIDDDSATESTVPVLVSNTGGTGPLTTVISVDAGPAHACAVLMDGRVACWGSATFGGLGQSLPPSGTDRPVIVTETSGSGELGGADEVSVGNLFTCARLGSEVACWGANSNGNFGDGTDTDTHVPQLSLFP